ncbi:MAG: phosphoglucomutase/phosphomannomutase family protein [Chloroflexi bacterium]|nr:phosphoglucomutase/phosphomannomutase family protein [Chloroflexota bacterium]
MPEPTIKFGTDGWRALIAEGFTFANVRACAAGVACLVQAGPRPQRGVVIGYDTRFGSEAFASAAAEVVAGAGLPVTLGDRAASTPALAFAVVTQNAAGGIVITSSHNPWDWNGFKYKPDYGGSATEAITRELEAAANAAVPRALDRLPLDVARREGKLSFLDPRPQYFRQLASLIDLERLRGAGLRVAVDSMHGAAAGYLAGLLKGGRTAVRELHGRRDPLFRGVGGRPEPIEPHLGALRRAIQRGRFHVGLATDGDGDRLGVLDERGRFVTQLQVYGLLALYMLEVRGERGPLVKALTSTAMAEKLGRLYHVPVFETAVGMKHLGSVFRREQALFGGEESGGFVFRGHIPERDGVLSALAFLDLMVALGKTPAQLVKYLYEKAGPHHYRRVDVTFPAAERERIAARLAAAEPRRLAGEAVSERDSLDGTRFRFADGSWLLIRFSGTEPLLRLYAEATSPKRVEALLKAGRELAGV